MKIKYRKIIGWVIIIALIVFANATTINVSVSFKDYNYLMLLVIPILFAINIIIGKIQKQRKTK